MPWPEVSIRCAQDAVACRQDTLWTALFSRPRTADTDGKVIWLFEREGKHARLEILYVPPDKYEVWFLDGDGVEHVEALANATDVANRQLDLTHTLAAQGWARTGGWKL